MTPLHPLLEVRDLRTWFRTPGGMVRAVDGVSLTLEAGCTLGIVGESGSGKTVLARSIMNLLPKRAVVPAGGEVLFDGRSIRGLGVRPMRRLWGRAMATVLQDPMTSLNPVVTIGQQLTEGLRQHRGLRGSAARVAAVDLLRSVGLPSPERRLGEYPHQLSGGMRQRVTIAIALSGNPELLIADEPTTALDVTVQRQILDLLQDQQRQRRMAMILITHDLGVVAGRTDEIAVMYAGQVVERASTETVFRRMRHPYTEALMGCIPRLEDPSHTWLEAIPGRPPDMAALPSGCRFAPRCRYAQERCLVEAPPLFAAAADPSPSRNLDTSGSPRATGAHISPSAGHVHRCFFPVGTDAGREALARNLAAGETAAATPVSAGTADVARVGVARTADAARAVVPEAAAVATAGAVAGAAEAEAETAIDRDGAANLVHDKGDT